MMKLFITITNNSGEKTRLRHALIQELEWSPSPNFLIGGYTTITTIDKAFYNVKETPEEIEHLMIKAGATE